LIKVILDGDKTYIAHSEIIKFLTVLHEIDDEELLNYLAKC
jgi:hypothetical protein